MTAVSDDERAPDRLSPEAAFELLGNRTRLGILRALFEADAAVGFTALRRTVGVEDSGQFNYHLNRLVGRYVTEVEDGYELSAAGEYVVGAILADAIDQRPGFGSFPVDGQCRHCGGALEAEFDDLGRIRCTDCGVVVMADAFPPAGELDRTPEETATAFDHWVRHRAILAWNGVCPRCAGRLQSEAVVPSDGGRVRVEYECGHCRHSGAGPLLGRLIEEPAVVSAFFEQGIDLNDLRYWELRRRLDAVEEEIVSTDPLRVRFRLPLESGELELLVDGDGEVLEVERPAGPGQ